MSRRAAAALLVLVLGLLGSGSVSARPLAPPPTPPDAGVSPALGAALPLALRFIDSDGRDVTLGDYFGSRPVLLVLGYYRCPQLCGLLMHGVLEALHDGGLARDEYRVLRVSIDPAETNADAHARRAVDLAYAAALAGDAAPAPPLDLTLLTGRPAALRALAQQVGFRYQRDHGDPGGPDDRDRAAWAHPAVAIVVTPEGRVSRYFGGIQFDSRELRLALVEASDGRIGHAGDRLALLCAHVDPRLGRHSEAVLRGLQAVGAALVLALLALFRRTGLRGSGQESA